MLANIISIRLTCSSGRKNERDDNIAKVYFHTFLIKEEEMSRGLKTPGIDRRRWDFSQYDSFIDKVFALLFYYVPLAPDTSESWGFCKLSRLSRNWIIQLFFRY